MCRKYEKLKRISACVLIMSLLCGVIPWNTFAAEKRSVSKGSVSATVKARKVLQGHVLQDRQFTFELLENGIVIQTAQNDAAGDITFRPITYKNAGTHRYTIRERNGGQTIDGIVYDSNEYEVNVTVREEDLKAPDQNKIYYGHAPDGEIFVGEYPGERGYEVYCIDQSKALPPKEPEARTKYIVLNDPDSKELESHVTMNRYGDKLAENLKKCFFYFQLFPDKYSSHDRREIVWVATGAYGDKDTQWEDVMKEIFQVSLPEEYHLVLFVPENKDFHQTLGMGYGAAIKSDVDSDISFGTAPPIFVNRLENAVPQEAKAAIKAKKILEGEKLVDKQFRFELLDEGGRLLQEATNDVEGNIQFQPITYTAPGEYRYKIREKYYGQTIDGIVHDAKVYDIVVTVTEKDLEGFQNAVKYYGIAPEGNYIFVGEKPGEKKYPVFCIDGNKTLPPPVTNHHTYKVVTDPELSEIERCVSINLWGDKLVENLKKIFYYFQVYPDKYGLEEQKNIVWAATGHYGHDLEQYEEIVNEIFKIELPAEYHLVVFEPQGQDRDFYQPLGMGYGVEAGNRSAEDMKMSLETPVFVNKISDAKTEFAPLAFKKVDGRNPFANENFEFVLHKEDGTVISKAQNNKQYISFPPIAYTAKDAGKTFRYYIDEVTKEGYICDTERVEVTVTVAFSAFAGLVAEGTYKKGNITSGVGSATFLNKTARDETTFVPEVMKMVDGKVPTAQEVFEFKMYTITEDGQKGALAGETSNIGKSVRFKPITYKKSDVGKTFFYRIEETKKDGFLCDTEPVDIKVTVTQNEMGLLKTEVTYTKGGVQGEKTFHNSSLENKGVISISKTVEGNGADQQEYFRFVMETFRTDGGDSDGEYDVMFENQEDLEQGQKNDSTLNVTAKKIRFDDEGKAVFYLKHGQTLHIRLPYDYYVSVQETMNRDYDVSLSVEGVPTIPGNGQNGPVEFEYTRKYPDVNIKFVNTKYEVVVPTGISLPSNSMKILAVLALLGGGCMLVIGRKKRRKGI